MSDCYLLLIEDNVITRNNRAELLSSLINKRIHSARELSLETNKTS